MKERFRWLAAAIAAHKDRKVVGRTRLQKEIKLLQRLGFPTEYSYTLFFYGPYSEGLHAEVRFLQAFGLVTEEERSSQAGRHLLRSHGIPGRGHGRNGRLSALYRPHAGRRRCRARARGDLRHVPHNEIRPRRRHDAAAPKKGRQV